MSYRISTPLDFAVTQSDAIEAASEGRLLLWAEASGLYTKDFDGNVHLLTNFWDKVNGDLTYSEGDVVIGSTVSPSDLIVNGAIQLHSEILTQTFDIVFQDVTGEALSFRNTLLDTDILSLYATGDVKVHNGLNIGTTSQEIAGNLRYAASKFEGYNGSGWINLGITDHGGMSGLLDNDHPLYNFDKTGWDLDAYEDVSMSLNEATREFSISPTGASFSYWISNTLYTFSTTQTVTIGDVEGIWFIYFDGATLTASQVPWSIRDNNKAFVAVLYWDFDLKEMMGDIQPELHSWSMDPATHDYNHSSIGTLYGSGLATSMVGTTQLSVTGGTIYDEDIKVQITDSDTPTAIWEQPLSPLATRSFYRTEQGEWTESVVNTTPVIISANTLQYNTFNGTNWILEDVSNNKFIVYWVVATNMISYPVVTVPGQDSGDSLQEARDNNNLSDMMMGSFPSPEHKVIARVIIQALVAAPYYEIVEINDYRAEVDIPTSTYTTVSHASLTGLLNDDHPQYALLTGRGGETLNIDILNAVTGYQLNGSSLKITDLGASDGAEGNRLIHNGTVAEWVKDYYIVEGIYLDNQTHTISAATHGQGTKVIVEFQSTSADGFRWVHTTADYEVNKATGDVTFTPKSEKFQGRVIIKRV